MGAGRGWWRLLLAEALALSAAAGCLQCEPSFPLRFASYVPRLSRKAWGLGDVPAAGRLLRAWPRRTLRELRLTVAPEIPLENLQEIAAKVFKKLEIVFSGKTYRPGVLPQILYSIFKEQVKMLQAAIIEGRLECERHCGIHKYEAISCSTCTFSKPTCFGYNCESSEEWEAALKGLFDYINNLPKQPKQQNLDLKMIPDFHKCTSTSPEMLNFTSINLTLSETWQKTRNAERQESKVSPPASEMNC
uniref:IZUMO family member 4 n=1 Tax=Sphenodon punctatus TaxID=8508 RepID=A0A8D0H795_SPHPU